MQTRQNCLKYRKYSHFPVEPFDAYPNNGYLAANTQHTYSRCALCLLPQKSTAKQQQKLEGIWRIVRFLRLFRSFLFVLFCFEQYASIYLSTTTQKKTLAKFEEYDSTIDTNNNSPKQTKQQTTNNTHSNHIHTYTHTSDTNSIVHTAITTTTITNYKAKRTKRVKCKAFASKSHIIST